MTRRLLLTLLPVLLGACTTSDDERLNVLVNYEIVQTAITLPPTITNKIISFEVVHGFTTPNPCYNFASRARQPGATIELTLEIQNSPTPGCSGGETHWRYTAMIVGMRQAATVMAISYGEDPNYVRTEYPITTP